MGYAWIVLLKIFEKSFVVVNLVVVGKSYMNPERWLLESKQELRNHELHENVLNLR